MSTPALFAAVDDAVSRMHTGREISLQAWKTLGAETHNKAYLEGVAEAMVAATLQGELGLPEPGATREAVETSLKTLQDILRMSHGAFAKALGHAEALNVPLAPLAYVYGLTAGLAQAIAKADAQVVRLQAQKEG